MIEIEYINYFEALARKNVQLKHNPEQNWRSFFCIHNPYETAEFDQALRSSAASTVFLLDAPVGFLSDNGSMNYTQTSKLNYMIVAKANKERIRQVRNDCFQIGMDVLERIGADAKKQMIIPGKSIYFDAENINYDVVGPINLDYYGYAFSFSLVCPFSFSSKTGAWTDIV